MQSSCNFESSWNFVFQKFLDDEDGDNNEEGIRMQLKLKELVILSWVDDDDDDEDDGTG